jgi:hypothetical protein
MSMKFQKGSSDMEGILILFVLGIIVFLFVLPSGRYGPVAGLSNVGQPSSTVTIGNNQNPNAPISPTVTTAYNGALSLSTGSAQYSYQPYEEYITLTNYSQAPIDLTGWTLQDARGQRTYNVSGGLQQFPSLSATIPAATKFISPNGQNTYTDVVLKPQETAIVTTGSVGNTNPYTITSFKENECSGYLGNLTGYKFTPQLNTQCVQPSNEPGVRSLDIDCQKFINSLPSCQTPKFGTINAYDNYTTDSQGRTCVGCVNGVSGLSNACVAFIQAHFNYPSCIAIHSNDPNFYGSTWRVFLNKPWEMWAADHESISLFDQQGRLAAYQGY